MAGHCCGVVRAHHMVVLLLACLLSAASGLDFPHDHHAISTHSSTAKWYRYEPEAAIAVDLGNTNSCIAGYTRGGPGETETMFRACIPSWVAFPDDGGVLVGEAAKNHADTHPEAAVFGFQRMLGLRYEDDDTVHRLKQRVPYKIGPTRYGVGPVIQLNAKDDDDGALITKELYVQEIATMVVDELRRKAEDHLGVRTTVRDAVIVVPAHSNNYASTQEARDAGRRAGLDVLGTVTAPVAAAVAYGLGEKLREDGNALVLHVGGGTADASVVTLTGDGYFDVLAYRDDTFLGGDDFDRRVVDHFVGVIKMKHGKDVSQDRAALRKLGAACERAKKALSSQDHAQVSIESLLGGGGGGGGMDFSETLSRRVFEKLNGDLFRKVIALVDSAMADSELERGEIDEIVLVGGSTVIPKIQRLVKDYFNGKEPNIRVKPDEAVALGAAVEIHSLKYRRFENLDFI